MGFNTFVPPDAMQQIIDETFSGDDENRNGTGERFYRYLLHFAQDYDPAKDLGVTFPAMSEDLFHRPMVIQRNIPFTACCAHHLLPFMGVAHVGYVPGPRVVGLSKLTRVVYGMSHRTPSLQETIGNEIADAMEQHLETSGVMVVIRAQHGCMACRGVEAPNVDTVTSSMRGIFATDAAARQEFYTLVGNI